MGAVVGTALVLGDPPWSRIVLIVSTWVLIPMLSFMLTYLLQRYLAARIRPAVRGKRKAVSALLTIGGCYEAFVAGDNNVANAVGPLVGAGLIASGPGVEAGGLGLARGALLLGSQVLSTNAKTITPSTC